MWWWLLACEPVDGGDSAVTGWQIQPAVNDSPRVAGATFDPKNGEGIGLAVGEFLPGFAEGNPAWDLPGAMLTVVLDDLVSDPGSCPYEVRSGDTSTYSSDCRSRDGYEWEGSFESREWDDGEIARQGWTFDLQVTADIDGAAFDTLSLEGAVVKSQLDGVYHVDVDLSASLVGYFEARGETDAAAIAAFADWSASGSVENSDAAVLVDGAINIAQSGVIPLVGSLDRSESCPIEPTGELDLSGGVAATFSGADGCDACADISEDGEAVSQACAP